MRIKAEVFPYEKHPVDKLLTLLHDAGFIIRYVANGDRYIQIVTWSKHQNPHVKETLSIIPEPVKGSDKNSSSTVLKLLVPDSLNPVLDSSSSDSLNPEPCTPPPNHPRLKIERNDDDKPALRKFATEADELVALIFRGAGEHPDRNLIVSIRKALELRGATLRAFLDDIEPRLGRLKSKPGFGFFHDHAKKFGGYEQQPVIANEIRGPCCRFGMLADGAFCPSCATGRDLQIAQRAIERERLNGGADVRH